MRDRRYRAWHKKDKCMCAVLELHWDTHGHLIAVMLADAKYGARTVSPGKCHLLEYTGAKDRKKGRKKERIFEGDVVWTQGKFRFKGTVCWNDDDCGGYWEVVGKQDERGGGRVDLLSRQCKRIGNKFENPEMLK